MICDSYDGKFDDRFDYGDYYVYCCYKNMCNDVNKINFILLIVNLFIFYIGKGNY